MDISYIINHLGEERDNYFGAVAPPVIQSSNFCFKDVASLRAAFPHEKDIPLYTRGDNPTVEILRKKIAALASAEDALIFGSGVAAISAAVMSQVKQGDHIVSIRAPYSWAEKLLNNYLPRFGVTTTMIDGRNVSNFERAIQPNTRLFYLESPNTFTFDLLDIEAVVKVAKKHGIKTIIDNSYCNILGQRCIEMGVDIEVHSASKYFGGHSDLVAGIVLSDKACIDHIFATEFLNIGGIISPHDAWLLLRSLRTLPIRLEKIGKSTAQVVQFMESHPMIEKVVFPFSPSFAQSALARKQMLWCGGLFTAWLKVKSVEEVERFCNSLKRFLLAVSWGGHESLLIPACSFSARTDGVQDNYAFNLIRFYVGLDEPEVLIEDLKQAFGAIG